MRAMAAMLLVLILSTGVFAQSKRVGTFQFEKKQGSHKALVIFHTRALADAGRRVTGVERGQTMVDGRPTIDHCLTPLNPGNSAFGARKRSGVEDDQRLV